MELFWCRAWKGKHDGMGVVVKRWLWHCQLQRGGVDLNDVAHVVSLLVHNLSLGVHSTFKSRQQHQESIHHVFHLVSMGDVDRREDVTCETVPGTGNNIFQVLGSCPSNHTLLLFRPLVCFCPRCVYGSFEDCISKEYLGGTWTTHMVPNGQEPADCFGDLPNEEDRPEYGSISANYDTLANLMEVGSFFVVPCEAGNEEEVPYYILQCTMPLERLKEIRSHTWDDTSFEPGDTVVTGRYIWSGLAELQGNTNGQIEMTMQLFSPTWS